MTETAKKIALQLNELGIVEGNVVLVHSSLKSLGSDVTPADVIDGLLYALGDSGTLVVPTLSYLFANKIHPRFDYYETPSNVGIIPEYFRTKYKGVFRSMCPTHSCTAGGKYARVITEEHYLDDTPCGSHSPFRKVYELGGKILFIGCGLKPNTSMHAIEELVNPDYLFDGYVKYDMTDSSGTTYNVGCRAHGFKNVTQRYDRVADILNSEEHIHGTVLAADCDLLSTEALWQKAKEKYIENPHYFVDTAQ